MTKASPAKKTTKKSTTKVAKSTASSKKASTKRASQKVDIYPNRMTLAISALAGTLIVLLALIAVLGIQ